MKETYWTQETVTARSREMLGDIKARSPWVRAFMPDLSHAALLVLDMQRYFLEDHSHAFIPSAPAIVPGIQRLISFFQSHDRPVILTRHLNDPADAGMMHEWWGELIRDSSPSSQIIPELRVERAEIFTKSQYDAFHETGMARHLMAHHIKQVVITGVMTHLCCETTARSAFVQGFNVFFPVDGTATYNELFHRSSLINLCHGFAIPLLIDDVIETLGMP